MKNKLIKTTSLILSFILLTSTLFVNAESVSRNDLNLNINEEETIIEEIETEEVETETTEQKTEITETNEIMTLDLNENDEENTVSGNDLNATTEETGTKNTVLPSNDEYNIRISVIGKGHDVYFKTDGEKYAFCIEPSKHRPAEGVYYKISDIYNNDEIKKIFVNAKCLDVSDDLGYLTMQYAIWTIVQPDQAGRYAAYAESWNKTELFNALLEERTDLNEWNAEAYILETRGDVQNLLICEVSKIETPTPTPTPEPEPTSEITPTPEVTTAPAVIPPVKEIITNEPEVIETVSLNEVVEEPVETITTLPTPTPSQQITSTSIETVKKKTQYINQFKQAITTILRY